MGEFKDNLKGVYRRIEGELKGEQKGDAREIEGKLTRKLKEEVEGEN